MDLSRLPETVVFMNCLTLSASTSHAVKRGAAGSPAARRVTLALLGLLAGLGLGCAPTPAPVPVEDLLAQWAWADKVVEPRKVKIGVPEGRQFLFEGWSQNETGEVPFVWGLGPRSTIALPIAVVRPLDLELNLRPFAPSADEPQSIEVRIADHVVYSGELGPELQRIRFALPVEHLTEGWNPIDFHWGRSKTPQELGLSGDTRPLTAGFYDLRLIDPDFDPSPEGAVDETLPVRRADGEDDRFWLPAGGRADFFVDLPPGSRLAYRIEPRGNPEIAWEMLDEQGASASRSFDPKEAAEDVVWLLPDVAGPVRLRATVLGLSGDGAMFFEPRILAPAGDAEEATDAVATAAAKAGQVQAQPDPASESVRRDLVLYSIDTLRADRLGYRGGPVPTPHLDGLASESLVFERLTAQSPWTKASMASVFTGLWPPSHGAMNRGHRLPPEMVTLAELLSAAGWATVAVVTNPNITANFGFDQGFDEFHYLGEKIPGGDVVSWVDNYLTDRAASGVDPDKPLFLWIHTIDPHSPYDPPDAYREDHLPEVSADLAEASLDVVNNLRAGRRALTDELMADLWALYDTEIQYGDESFGELRRVLERHGLDDAVLTVLSDHGEEFMEHGNWEHGRALHVESLDVPWIVYVPGMEPHHVDTPAQHLDVLPTLLAVTGAPGPSGLAGHAWLDPGARLIEPEAPRRIFSHLHLDGAERLSIEDGTYKLMVEMRGDEAIFPQLFDLRADGAETHNLWGERPVRGGWLRRLLLERRSRGTVQPGEEVQLDEETRKSLEALGYL